MMNPNNPQTPGVYTVEKNAFPPSVAQVPTAIPAFVGYTEKAEYEGKSLLYEPRLISSLKDYQIQFGGAPEYQFPVIEVPSGGSQGPPAPGTYDFTISLNYYKIGFATSDTLYYMYNCLRLFYLNGGGPAYIVSVGTYQAAESTVSTKGEGAGFERKPNPVSRTALLDGLDTLRFIPFPKPTMIVIPDTMALESADDCYMVQQQMIAQAGELRDRVALLDIYEGWKDYRQPDNDVISYFRNNMGVSNLSYAIAYYPWLQSEVVSASEITYLNVAPVPTNTPPASDLRDINELFVGVPLLGVLAQLSADYEHLEEFLLVPPPSYSGEIYPTWTASFNSVMSVTYNDVDILNGQANAVAEMYSIIYALGQTGEYTPKGAIAPYIKIASNDLINSIKVMTQNTGPLGSQILTAYAHLKDFPGNNKPIGLTSANLTELGWTSAELTAATKTSPYNIPPSLTIDLDKQDFVFPMANQVMKTAFDTMLTALNTIVKNAKTLVQQHNSSLETSNRTYKHIMAATTRMASVLPPASAMAGIYTTVDNTQGVWHAPVNRNIDAVIEPLVNINDDAQASLNVDTLAGKSINVIRSYYGGSPAMVWGARTMAGNSPDWRYINVRRLMIMIEQSVANAAFSLVFEPNDSSTWTKCESMITNFLHNLWQEGALLGSTPAAAYSVMVGLGKTMMPLDILNGIMRVEVKVAAVRPAEFINITYEQEVAKS